MIDLRKAALGLAFLFVACGGSEKPASDATSTTTVTPPSGSAASQTDAPPSAPDMATTTKPADSAGSTTATSEPPKDDKRLEDMKMKKTTSAGGSYAVNVVAAKGLAPEDVVRAIGTKPDECYAKLFKKQLAANGKTTFEIAITAKGKTQSAKMKSDDLKDGDIVKCLEKVLKGVDWPNVTDKAGGKTTVDFAVAGS